MILVTLLTVQISAITAMEQIATIHCVMVQTATLQTVRRFQMRMKLKSLIILLVMVMVHILMILLGMKNKFKKIHGGDKRKKKKCRIRIPIMSPLSRFSILRREYIHMDP